jgi:hypothetical protein
MTRTRRITVDATIVECFRAWEEPWRTPHPWFEIVADLKTPAGEVERITWRQRLDTYTHHWSAPDPGDVVPINWDPVHGRTQLDLRRDPRYDRKVIKRLGRTREGPTYPPHPGIGGPGT